MATNVRDIARVKGSVFDLPGLLALSDNDANLLCVSTRTLAIIQAYSRLEIDIQARYARQILAGNQYIIADSASEIDDITSLANNFKLEVIDVTCDIVAAIQSLTLVLQQTRNDCGCNVGEGPDNEAGSEGGPIPTSVGSISYAEPVAVDARRCKISNLTFETLLTVFQELDAHRVDELGVAGMIAAIGLVSALIAAAVATPLVGVIVGVAGVLAALVARVIGLTIDLGLIVTVLEDNAVDLVCALYNNSDVDSARSAFETVITDDGRLTAVEIATVMLPLTNAWLNTLFFDVDGLSDYLETYAAPYDCAQCVGSLPIIWTFETGFEGWTFEDQSTLPSSASAAHSTGQIDIHYESTGVQAKGQLGSPILSIPVAVPNKVEVDLTAVVPPLVNSTTLRVNYTDLSTQAQTFNGSGATTITINVNGTKTIEEILVVGSRTNTPATDYAVTEVRVIAA